jgi:hypothetical protein
MDPVESYVLTRQPAYRIWSWLRHENVILYYIIYTP